MGDTTNSTVEITPTRRGTFHRVVGVGFGLLLGAMTGVVVGLVAGVGIAMILGVL